MTAEDRNQLLTITQFAKEVGLSERTIHRYIRDHRIDAYRLGPQALRVKRNQIDKLITKIK